MLWHRIFVVKFDIFSKFTPSIPIQNTYKEYYNIIIMYPRID